MSKIKKNILNDDFIGFIPKFYYNRILISFISHNWSTILNIVQDRHGVLTKILMIPLKKTSTSYWLWMRATRRKTRTSAFILGCGNHFIIASISCSTTCFNSNWPHFVHHHTHHNPFTDCAEMYYTAKNDVYLKSISTKRLKP